MGLVKITFDGSSVSAKQDADINYHLTGLISAGIIKGLGNELSYSFSNNYITFQSGYVQIYGRRIFVEAGSQVYISLDGTKYGYVVITVNLSNNSVTLSTIESTSSYPTLTQQNLATGGTTYQMPIAKYSKTATSLTVDTSYARTYIETPLSVANSGYEKSKDYVQNNYGSWTKYYADESTSTSWKFKVSSWNFSEGVIFVNINDCVMIPVCANFINNHSSAYVYYMLDGTSYKLGCGKISSEYIGFYTSTSSHKVQAIYCVR